MNDPMQIAGAAELVKAGHFVMYELLRVISEDGGEMAAKLSARIAEGEQPMLTVRGLPDGTGTVVELVTQQEGDATFTRIAILPILKVVPGRAIN